MPTYAKSHLKLGYSADGALLAVGIDDNPSTLTLWDIERGNRLGILQSEERPFRIGFSPTNSQLVISGREDTIQTWNIGEPNARPASICEHLSPCGAVKFSPDGNTLVTGHWSGVIKLWDAEGLELQKTFKAEGRKVVRSIDFSPLWQ